MMVSQYLPDLIHEPQIRIGLKFGFIFRDMIALNKPCKNVKGQQALAQPTWLLWRISHIFIYIRDYHVLKVCRGLTPGGCDAALRSENKILMLKCPHCNCEIQLKKLPHQGFLNSFRVCPSCKGKFTVDKSTKHRQAIFIVISLISLAFTILMYFKGTDWLIPSVTSYIILGGQ